MTIYPEAIILVHGMGTPQKGGSLRWLTDPGGLFPNASAVTISAGQWLVKPSGSPDPIHVFEVYYDDLNDLFNTKFGIDAISHVADNAEGLDKYLSDVVTQCFLPQVRRATTSRFLSQYRRACHAAIDAPPRGSGRARRVVVLAHSLGTIVSLDALLSVRQSTEAPSDPLPVTFVCCAPMWAALVNNDLRDARYGRVDPTRANGMSIIRRCATFYRSDDPFSRINRASFFAKQAGTPTALVDKHSHIEVPGVSADAHGMLTGYLAPVIQPAVLAEVLA